MQAAADANNITTLVDRIRMRDVRAIARAISLIEDDALLARELLSLCFSHTGRALHIGITGSPGAGKSTLVDQLSRHYLEHSSTVGVLAVDPSSPYTGGALLGDRIRMQEHHANLCFYLRSMATRGALGGLARATADAASILDAAGFERIFIETVGVGQDEIDIVKLADITIVVLVPGMGDDVQSIKAGIMEVADIFVINKNDREGADRVQAEVKAMQSLAHGATDWTPPIVCTNSLSSEGIPELAAAIDSFRVWLAQDCRLALRRRAQWKQRLAESIRHQLFAEAALRGLDDEQLEMHAAAVACREENPFAIVTTLITDMLQRK